MLVQLILNGGRVMSDGELLRLSSQIVAAYAANTELSSQDLTQLISDVRTTLRSLGKEKTPLEPAFPIEKSATPDYLVWALSDQLGMSQLIRGGRDSHAAS